MGMIPEVFIHELSWNIAWSPWEHFLALKFIYIVMQHSHHLQEEQPSESFPRYSLMNSLGTMPKLCGNVSQKWKIGFFNLLEALGIQFRIQFRYFFTFVVLDFIVWFNCLGHSKNYFIYLFFVYLDPPWSLLLYQMWRLWVMKFQNLAFYESNWLRQNQNNAYNSGAGACVLLLFYK